MAPAKPSRVRKRRVEGSSKSNERAPARSTTCFGETGGTFLDAGVTNDLLLVIVNAAAVPEAEALTDPGPLQVALRGAPVQLSVTALVKPPTPTTLTVNGWLPPSVRVTFCVAGVSEKSGVMADCPVPLRVTVCGLPVAVSAIESVPLRDPVAAGVNTTLITQLEPAPDVV